MKRGEFLKAFGFAIVAPSVLITKGGSAIAEVKKDAIRYKRWPIYPETNVKVAQYHNRYITSEFTYVKVATNGNDFLVPVGWNGYSDDMPIYIGNSEEFSCLVRETQEKFIVDENNSFQFENGLVIKYDPKIHHN